MLFRFHYLQMGLICRLKFSWLSPAAFAHNHNICIHKIQCQSFHKSNSSQQKNPNWGYAGFSQAVEESAEDQNRFQQRYHHSNIYEIGIPKSKPKTPQEVERRLRYVLYQHDKRKDYLHTMDSDLHWDLGIAYGTELSESKMERFLRLGQLGQLGGGGLNATPQDSNQVDTSETVYISSLALLKMLKHGRAGVPMEVMGLMLGEFVDDFTVNVIDVFAMPQSGTGVSVEAVDPVFQAKMIDMLKQTGRPEMVVGWYHSHPGFGCWLSGVDINTQQSFEALSERAVAVVVDPIQSVKGKVVIDAFRTINPQVIALNQEPRQTTSNIGHLQKPSIQALIHGLNRHYYSIPIAYRTSENEQQTLLNLNKQSWMDSMALEKYHAQCAGNDKSLEQMLKLAKLYKKSLEEEEKMTEEQLTIKNVGKQDPKRHLGDTVDQMLADNLVQNLAAMLDLSVFQ